MNGAVSQNQSSTTSTRLTGTVRRFNPHSGWGFITRDDSGGDVFVHYSGIAGTGYRTLREGQGVTFAVALGKGPLPMAVDVRVTRP